MDKGSVEEKCKNLEHDMAITVFIASRTCVRHLRTFTIRLRTSSIGRMFSWTCDAAFKVGRIDSIEASARFDEQGHKWTSARHS